MTSTGDSSRLLLSLAILASVLPGVLGGFACLSNPCVHGVCLDDLNSTYFCYCIDGYTGVQCQTNWNECWDSPCRNGATCVDGVATFNCSCAPGYTGQLCDEDINECESNPCHNNGTCLDVQNGYVCNCLPGYSGDHCEIDVAVCNETGETRCLNGGMCEEGPGESFTCRCPPGWGGFLCDNELDECMSAPCQNGAVCVDLLADYSCACLFGYTGRNCEEVIQICDNNPCKNGALCLIEEGRSVCYCVPDFHGELCQFQYDECQLGPRCKNGGSCIDGIDNFTCSCPPDLTGVLCECLILGDNTLDCSYVSTGVYETSTMTTGLPTITTAIENATIIPLVPTTEILSTTTEYYNESLATTTVTFTEVTFSATTDEPTVTYTTVNMTEATTTSSMPTTTEISSTTSTEVPVTDPTQPSSTLYTTETATVTELTTISTTSTPLNYETKTEYSTVTLSTLPIDFTSPPAFTTSQESTTVELSSIYPTFSSSMIPETNRSFPETSTVPSVSTFLTTEPTRKLESSTTSMEDTTMVSTEEVTTTLAVDCTQVETPCENGGTCAFTGKGHGCICPFDTEGPYCEIKLGVRNAAFNGQSYLTHRLNNFTHILIGFEAKTMASGGLLFYATIDSSYMTLYIEHGHLRFKFSCGHQTMLLSELRNPVNNGYAMNIEAVLEFSKDFKHCDATIKINDTLSMTGDQMAKLNVFTKPTAWLHLGGVPMDLVSSEGTPVEGFVGCMKNLKVSKKKVKIYKDAEDGFEITECSSLACLSNPCRNGASCTSVGENWQCHCKNGYLGRTCEISICDDNPCLYGGTCIPFTNSGYICLCPYGKHGHFCENDLKITEPHFSSTIRGLSSYVAYSLPDGVSKTMELKFRFTPTTMEQISLMLFIGQSGLHDFYSDHMAVSFVKGYVMLTWNLGSGPRRIFTSKPIKKGSRDYLVRFGHTGRRAWLYVDDLGNTTGRSPGNLVTLDVSPVLFIGGHDSRNFSDLPHDLPLHTGFSGCIFDVEMKSGSVVISFQSSIKTYGRAVGQCGITECFERSCQNGGACLHHGSTFMCLCQDNWYGPLCSSRNNLCDSNHTLCLEGSRCVPLLSDYECDCPLGKTGKYCEEEESISDVSLTGKRSYIALLPIDIESSKFHVELELRTLKDQGMVMFVGKRDFSFVSLSMMNGLLELRIQTGKHKTESTPPASVRSSKLLIKAVWHRVKFGLYGRKIYLSVDNIINTGVLDMGHLVSLTRETVFVGGLPDLSRLPLTATSSLPSSYKGCIRHLSIDDKPVLFNSSNIRDSRNVIDCDGTPCGGETCLHGGTCWLDSFMRPHCSCQVPYYGDRCEILPDCDDKSCGHGGRCLNNRCLCRTGWKGAYCEYEVKVKAAEFTGRSYLVVGKGAEKKRQLRSVDVKNIKLNFTTTKLDGLLVWSKKDSTFIGIGLEKGHLKLAYSPERSNKTVIEIPPFYHLADGLWHGVEINLNPVFLQIDGRKVSNKLDTLSKGISTNGMFYIGGVPTNSSLVSTTYGLFPHPFEGCVKEFGSNAEEVEDFGIYDGFGVDSCETF